MPKQILWHSNERVDLKDLEYGTATYPSELQKFLIERVGLDNYSRIVEGFRIKLPAPPSLTFTVSNGVAFDRSGQLVNDEDQYNASESVTLSSGNNNHFVEVELDLVESTQEPRAFWDSSYDNGLDTSGDELADGREFKETVSTRKTLTWKIVTNTTAFSNVATPSSVRIPIAIVKVTGSAIVGTATYPASILRKDAASSSTSLHVFNAREFEVGKDVTISLGGTSEVRAISAINYENGILTVAGLTNSYVAGARVTVSSGTQDFIAERTTPATPSPTSTTVDARSRYFQADDDLGYALSQDPYSASGRSDLTINNEKNYKDFVASQIRELKFGGLKATEVGNKAPASSFSAAPRYYDFAGSVLGGRAHTVSVGDGINSWGDFNSTQSGSAHAALQAAHDALPTEGGIVYVKKGSYSITGASSFTITKNIILLGDGRDVTRIHGTSSSSIVTVDSGTAKIIQIYNINIEVTNGNTLAGYGLECKNAHIIIAENCAFTNAKFIFKDPANYHFTSAFYNCVFLNDVVLNQSVRLNVLEIQGKFATFEGCAFVNTADNSGSTAASTTLLKTVAASESISFRGCRFIDSTNISSNLVYLDNTCTHVSISDSYFKGTGTASIGVYLAASSTVTNLTIDNCRSEIDNKFLLALAACSNVEVKNSSFSFIGSGSTKDFIKIHNSGTSNFITISSCSFKQTTTAAGTVYSINLGSATNCDISNCVFEDCQYGIKSVSSSKITINGCKYYGTTASKAKALFIVEGSDTVTELIISKCVIHTAHGGIIVSSALSSNILIDSCEFKTVGGTSGGSYYAIYMNTVTNVAVIANLVDTINSSSSSIGVYIIPSSGGSNYKICNNIFNNIGSNSESIAAYAISISGSAAYSNILINSNSIRTVGHSALSTTNVSGVRVSCVGAVCSCLGISNNNIDGVYHDDTAVIGPSGIYVYQGATDVVIKGNTIKTNALYSAGILFDKPDLSAVSVKNIFIDGNIITQKATAKISYGIRFDKLKGSDGDSGITITNNTIAEFKVSGIEIVGDSSNLVNNIVISNNNIGASENPTAIANGITVSGGKGVSISGNHVNADYASNKQKCFGVYVSSSQDVNIASNHVEVFDTDSYIVGLSTVDRGSVFSNYLSVKTGTQSNKFIGTQTSTKIVVLNNLFVGCVAGADSNDLTGTLSANLRTKYADNAEIESNWQNGTYGNVAIL